jgi:hypothetical protein
MLGLIGIPYDIAGSAELATIDLNPYEVVFVANDQTPEFYDTLAAQMDRLTAYAQGGGYLWLGVAGWGYNGGEPDGLPLPGGGSVDGPDFWDDNMVEAPNHPVAAGLPNPFTGTSASHTTVSGFPDGTVIATTPFGDATLVEYDLGVGRVLVVAQPVEFAWDAGQDSALILINSVPHAVDFEPFTDVAWLDVEPLDGTVAAGSTVDLTVTVSAEDLEPGSYEATVVVVTDDPVNARLSVPVRLTVAAGAAEIGVVAAGLRPNGFRSGLLARGW